MTPALRNALIMSALVALAVIVLYVVQWSTPAPEPGPDARFDEWMAWHMPQCQQCTASAANPNVSLCMDAFTQLQARLKNEPKRTPAEAEPPHSAGWPAWRDWHATFGPSGGNCAQCAESFGTHSRVTLCDVALAKMKTYPAVPTPDTRPAVPPGEDPAPALSQPGRNVSQWVKSANGREYYWDAKRQRYTHWKQGEDALSAGATGRTPAPRAGSVRRWRPFR